MQATRFQVTDGGQSEEEDEDEAQDLLDGQPGEGNQDTKMYKSFRHFTREALPRLDNYRNILSIQAQNRPTLDELHNATLSQKVSSASEHQDQVQRGHASASARVHRKGAQQCDRIMLGQFVSMSRGAPRHAQSVAAAAFTCPVIRSAFHKFMIDH